LFLFERAGLLKKEPKITETKKTFLGLIYLYTYVALLLDITPSLFFIDWLTWLASCNFYCFGNSSIMVLNLRLQPMFVHILIVVEKNRCCCSKLNFYATYSSSVPCVMRSSIKCVKFFWKGKFIKKNIVIFFLPPIKWLEYPKMKLFMICSKKLPQMVLYNCTTVVAGRNILMKSPPPPTSFLNFSIFLKYVKHNKCSRSKLLCYSLVLLVLVHFHYKKFS
jgi:hypothetical protein